MPDTDADTTIAQIQETMKTDFRTYTNDSGMQEKYLSALQTREGTVAPTSTAGDWEIAGIEGRIKHDNKGYRGDAKMQARYRELLETRRGEAPTSDAPKHGYDRRPEVAKPEPVTGFSRSEVKPEPVVNTGFGHSTALDTADIIAELQTEPEMASVLQGWGGDVDENVAYLAREATEILNAMPVNDARVLQTTVDVLTPRARANLYRHLADAGRARWTR